MTVLGAVRCKRQRHLSVTGACAQSHLHCMQIYKEFSSGFSWVPLYSLIVAEEELMNVAESPLKTGEETGEKRRRQKQWRGDFGAGGSKRMEPGATVLTRQVLVVVEESLA